MKNGAVKSYTMHHQKLLYRSNYGFMMLIISKFNNYHTVQLHIKDAKYVQKGEKSMTAWTCMYCISKTSA